MKLAKFWAVLVWSLTSTLTATAHEASTQDSVKCIQEQLNVSGFAAGSVDGVFGKRTHRALQAFAQKHGMPTEPPLIMQNANTYCRRLGLINPDLKRFWPSLNRSFQITAAASVAPAVVTQVETILSDLFVKIPAKLNLELAGAEQIVIAVTPEEIIKLVKEQSSVHIVNAAEHAKEACPPTTGAAGQAISGLFWICVPPNIEEFRGKGLSGLKFVIAHELTHSVQFQVSGTTARPVGNSRKFLMPGAIWFIEGIAHVVARTTTRDFDLSRYERIGVGKYNKQRVPNLADLEHFGRLKENRQDVYYLGELAAAHLIAEHGFEVVSKLFQALGEGQSWPAAFLRATGQTPKSFYDSFYQAHNARAVTPNNSIQWGSYQARRQPLQGGSQWGRMDLPFHLHPPKAPQQKPPSQFCQHLICP
ncbi:peptidoglycan-binding domain-containing protein [Pseudophaeobacter sp.]|uniref:peptidoglycan-binding domain-containing protein n=1 Tax=Pseudophaeobacter sp. TaxID=1971739 RepID=UPI00329837E6